MHKSNLSSLTLLPLLTIVGGCAPQYIEPSTDETATLIIETSLPLNERPSVRIYQGECSSIGNCSTSTIELATKYYPGEESKFFGKSHFEKTAIKIPANQKFRLNALWYPYGERGDKVCNVLSSQILAMPKASYLFRFEDKFENNAILCFNSLTELPSNQ